MSLSFSESDGSINESLGFSQNIYIIGFRKDYYLLFGHNYSLRSVILGKFGQIFLDMGFADRPIAIKIGELLPEYWEKRSGVVDRFRLSYALYGLTFQQASLLQHIAV
jgi:hypothetical protein